MMTQYRLSAVRGPLAQVGRGDGDPPPRRKRPKALGPQEGRRWPRAPPAAPTAAEKVLVSLRQARHAPFLPLASATLSRSDSDCVSHLTQVNRNLADEPSAVAIDYLQQLTALIDE